MFGYKLAGIAGDAAHEPAVTPFHELHIRIMRIKVHTNIINDYTYIITYRFATFVFENVYLFKIT